MIYFFIKKANNTNIYFRVFTIRDNLIKNSIKKRILLIIKINLEFETLIIIAILYYIRIKKKLNGVIYQVKYEDKKEQKKLDLKI